MNLAEGFISNMLQFSCLKQALENNVMLNLFQHP